MTLSTLKLKIEPIVKDLVAVVSKATTYEGLRICDTIRLGSRFHKTMYEVSSGGPSQILVPRKAGKRNILGPGPGSKRVEADIDDL
jgi:hypothetical protein